MLIPKKKNKSGAIKKQILSERRGRGQKKRGKKKKPENPRQTPTSPPRKIRKHTKRGRGGGKREEEGH